MTIGKRPAWMAGFDAYVDAKIAQALGGGEVEPRFGTITQAGPVRVLLDGDEAPVGYEPPVLYPAPKVGDRVWCVKWRRQIVVVGTVTPQAPPTDTGWVTCSIVTSGNWTFTGVGADKAQYRNIGGEIDARGFVRIGASGIGYNVGIVSVPYSKWYADSAQPVGTATNYTSGGKATLHLGANAVLYIEAAKFVTGTWSPNDYVHLQAHYRTN